MKCIVCERNSSKKYCVFHEKAYRNVVLKFDDWQQALGISWKEYLKAIADNSCTGSWAKEVALRLLSDME